MKRLTEKEVNACGIETGFYSVKNGESNNYILDNLNNPRNLNKMFLAKQKLGHLEDLEEELGIDLITLFKALRCGIWIYDNGSPFFTSRIKLSWHLDSIYCDTSDTNVLLREYGKTWALTKEELE